MAQYHIYPNPGTQRAAIPYLLAVQNDHITNRAKIKPAIDKLIGEY